MLLENSQKFKRNASNNWENDTEYNDDSNTIMQNDSLYDNDINKVKNQRVNIPLENILDKKTQGRMNSDFNFFVNEKPFQKNDQVYKQYIQSQIRLDDRFSKYSQKFTNSQLAKINKKQKEDFYNGVDVNKVLLDSKIFLNGGRFEEAEKMLQECIDKEIEHSDIFYMIGETKRLLGKLKESEFYLLQGLQFQVHSPFIFNSLGLVYMEIESYQRAILLFRKYLELNDDSKASFNLGRCLVREKEFTQAAMYFSKAIEVNDDEPYYYLHRGDCYEALGFTELAVQDFRKFKQLKPDYLIKLRDQEQEALQQNNKNQARIIQDYIKKLNLF